MKITIQLEVAPHEVPLATELLAVLRGLTDHVSVTSPGGAPPPAPPPALPAAPPAGPPPAAPPPPPSADELAPVFRDLVAAAEAPGASPAVAAQLEALAWAPSEGAPPAARRAHPAFLAFLNAWTAQAFDPALATAGRANAPYALMLAHAAPDFRAAVRDAAIPPLLAHLTRPRALDADRAEFFAHAEVFAALTSIEMMPIAGAVSTICTLLRDPAKKAAAVTVLGKTVELCGDALAAGLTAAKLAELRVVVAAVDEEAFRYDIEFIQAAMGWAGDGAGGGAGGAPGGGAPDGAPVAGGNGGGAANGGADPAAAAWTLAPAASFTGHGGPLFSLAADGARGRLVSGGRDPFLQVWSEDGAPLGRLALDGRLATALDFHPRLGLLLAAGSAAAAGGKPGPPHFVGGWGPGGEPTGFASVGAVVRAEAHAAALRALPDSNGFVTGEALPRPGGRGPPVPVVQFWDAGAAGGSFAGLHPAQAFTGHEEPVTCLAPLPGGGLFASGAKDGRIFVWDLRQARRVAALGDAPAGGGAPRATSGTLVTCLEAVPGGTTLLSGSTDRHVKLWDLRSAGSGAAPALGAAAGPGGAVLRIAALPGARAAALACMPQGGAPLAVLDFSDEAAPTAAPVACAWPGGAPPTYHDVKWGAGGAALFAAGRAGTVEKYVRVVAR